MWHTQCWHFNWTEFKYQVSHYHIKIQHYMNAETWYTVQSNEFAWFKNHQHDVIFDFCLWVKCNFLVTNRSGLFLKNNSHESLSCKHCCYSCLYSGPCIIRSPVLRPSSSIFNGKFTGIWDCTSTRDSSLLQRGWFITIGTIVGQSWSASTFQQICQKHLWK